MLNFGIEVLVAARSAFKCPGHVHKSVGLRVGQRFQEDRIDDGENGRVCTYAQGQRCDRRGGESGAFSQHAKRLAHVGKQRFHVIQNAKAVTKVPTSVGGRNNAYVVICPTSRDSSRRTA